MRFCGGSDSLAHCTIDGSEFIPILPCIHAHESGAEAQHNVRTRLPLDGLAQASTIRRRSRSHWDTADAESERKITERRSSLSNADARSPSHGTRSDPPMPIAKNLDNSTTTTSKKHLTLPFVITPRPVNPSWMIKNMSNTNVQIPPNKQPVRFDDCSSGYCAIA